MINKKTTLFIYVFFILLLVLKLCTNNGWCMFSSEEETAQTVSETSEPEDTEPVSTPVYSRRSSLRYFDPDVYEILDAKGLFIETGSMAGLNYEPTRLEGVVMLIKLLGKESEVLDIDGVQNGYNDVPLKRFGYVYYAVMNDYAQSISKDEFGADTPLSLNEYIAYVLSALGYSESSGDFVFSEAHLKGVELGLISTEEIETINSDIFTIGDMGEITYRALSMPLKGREVKLKDALADSRISGKEKNGKNVLLQDFLSGNKTDYTTAIVRAHEYLESIGGGTLIFEEGNYLIEPNLIFIPSDVKWLGEGNARLYTQESKLYNVLISTRVSAENIHIKNLTFDQMGDIELIPDVRIYRGCFIIHISDTDNVMIENCTFYTYGVCAILSQSRYEQQTNNITVRNNEAYFQRKTDKFYDVSVFNIDGRHVVVEDNHIESLNAYGFRNWKARSAYELHMPDGVVRNNSALNTEVGILHLAWPALWDTYEPDFEGAVSIENNDMRGVIIGVSLWGPTTIEGVVTRNLSIINNHIGLYLSKEYIPAQGIAIVDGDIGNGGFDDILIKDNRIDCTVSSEISDVNKVMDLMIPGKDVGAIYANTSNSIERITISDNVVNGFPYAFLNLYKRDGDKSTGLHRDIQVINNTIIDSGFVQTHEKVFEGLFSLGNCRNIEIWDNKIIKDTRDPIYLLSIFDSVEGLSFFKNDLSSFDKGMIFQYSDFEVFKNQEYDIPFLLDLDFVYSEINEIDLMDVVPANWVNSRKIEVEETSDILPGDRLFTPNKQPVIVTKVDGEYLYVLNDMSDWQGSKYLKRRNDRD